ncbi:MAG TPA: transposase [Candidatus Tectomicrobia bacterium]|nr:transposase [Candidatus Tectomicrobia bacterium]
MAHDTTLAVEQGDAPALPRVEVDGPRFRVRSAMGSTQWLPDTPSNRHLTLVWFRLLVDAHGKPLFTLQELATIVGSTNRQAASQHLEDFRQCGADMRAFVLRKRKVDTTVVEGVLHELLQTPLAGPTELVPRVQARLQRHDLSVANIESALEQISCVPVLRTLRRQLEAGQVHYHEAHLLTEMLETLSAPPGPAASWGVPSADGEMRLADPTALAALVTPDLPLAQVPDSLCWLTFLMTLFYWNVPLSVLGRWCGVHKTTLLRWVVGLALALWPMIAQWLVERVQAHRVYIDEKWLKIRGHWQYWFVVLDVPTELPVLAALLPSRSQWACRWVGAQLRQLKKIPGVIITDGLPAYAYLLPAAKHVLCRFHHQQGVTHWLKRHFVTDAEIEARKPMMKKLLQTRDKRTVRRRLARLKAQAAALGITPWVTGVEEKLPQLIGSVGSRHVPSTTNAIERFFRAFERFYKTRKGFHSVRSAKRELLLFLVVYLFTQRASTGQAPIEVILPEARRMPLYRLINDPFRALQERGTVKRETEMAELLLAQEAAD